MSIANEFFVKNEKGLLRANYKEYKIENNFVSIMFVLEDARVNDMEYKDQFFTRNDHQIEIQSNGFINFDKCVLQSMNFWLENEKCMIQAWFEYSSIKILKKRSLFKENDLDWSILGF